MIESPMPSPASGDRVVLERKPLQLQGLPRCMKRRSVPCDEAAIERLADRYRRHLVRGFGDRGDEIALALREELINYLEHSGGFDPRHTLKVLSCRIGTHLVFFWGMETDRDFDPSIRRSGPHRGHGLRLIGSFAELHLVDRIDSARTGTGSTTIFDLRRTS